MNTLPALHRRFLDEVLPRIQGDGRVVGVAVAGSIAHGEPDENSDVDLVIAVEDSHFEQVMAERIALIRSWAPLVAGFTGEHVGEPRVIISLVGPPLLHVDLKFVRISDFAIRIDDPAVLWERDSRLTTALAERPPAPPIFDFQWIEDRFWVWMHYGATKLARGELYEVIGFLAYLRETVFGPLLSHLHRRPLNGVRRLESLYPDEAKELQATLSGHDVEEAGNALSACVRLYRRWRQESGADLDCNTTAEELAVRFLEDVIEQSQVARTD